MNYKLSKEIIGIDPAKKPGNELMLYKIESAENHLLGQFFFYPQEQIIYHGDREVHVKVVSTFLKRTKYFLIDNKNAEQIGEYEILGGFGINLFWQDLPTPPIGTIKLYDASYNFRRVPVAVRNSTSKQETWGDFKFRLYSVRGQELYEYSLRIDMFRGQAVGKKPFTGTIASNSNNILTILAGIFLMEKEFAYEDSKDSG